MIQHGTENFRIDNLFFKLKMENLSEEEKDLVQWYTDEDGKLDVDEIVRLSYLYNKPISRNLAIVLVDNGYKDNGHIFMYFFHDRETIELLVEKGVILEKHRHNIQEIVNKYL